MFVSCPHCQFLVACPPPRREPLASDCPRCGRPLATGPATEAVQTEVEASPAAHASAHAAMLRALGGGQVDEAAAADASIATGSVEPPVPDTRAADDDNADADAETVTEAVTEAAPAAADPRPASPPSTLAVRKRHSLWERLRWPLIALLALLLALQMLLADRARLATDPDWRPVLESLCGALGCALPPWHEPGAFTMLDRQVRPAAQAGVLRVDATFRNDARWAQDWPALQLALSDADGRVVGSQVFAPADYLGAAPAPQLSPGQSAQVSFLVQEPATGTVAFSFEFR